MKLHELTKLSHRAERVGRGIAAGQGKTAGRGTKGQKARTGRGAPVGFEGGQTRLYRRLPKKGGFTSLRKPVATVTLTMLDRVFTDGARVDHAGLVRAGLVRSSDAAKIVNRGVITRQKLRIGADVQLTQGARTALNLK